MRCVVLENIAADGLSPAPKWTDIQSLRIRILLPWTRVLLLPLYPSLLNQLCKGDVILVLIIVLVLCFIVVKLHILIDPKISQSIPFRRPPALLTTRRAFLGQFAFVGSFVALWCIPLVERSLASDVLSRPLAQEVGLLALAECIYGV